MDLDWRRGRRSFDLGGNARCVRVGLGCAVDEKIEAAVRQHEIVQRGGKSRDLVGEPCLAISHAVWVGLDLSAVGGAAYDRWEGKEWLSQTGTGTLQVPSARA